MTPVMQGSVNDACEEPTPPSQRVWENCAGHGCPPLLESDLDFVLPSAMKGLRRLMLPVLAGGDVCRVLKCSSDGRMRPPIRCPEQAAVNVLLSKFFRFHFCSASVTIKCRLRSISASCRCNGGGYAHVQGRTAAWDRSGGKNISRPGLRSGESSGFRRKCPGPQVSCRKPRREHTHSAPAWLQRCCRFLRAPAEGPERSRSTDTARHPPRSLLPSLFWTLVM